MLARLLTMWRASLAMMSPESSKSIAELSSICKAKHDRKLHDHDVLKKLCLVMGSVPYYKALLGDFERTQESTEARFGDIHKFKDILDDDACPPAYTVEAVNLYVAINGKVRTGLAEGFFATLSSSIEASKPKFATIAPPPHQENSIIGDIDTWLDLFRGVAKATPEEECSVAHELTKATKMMRYKAMQSNADEVATHFQTLTRDWLGKARDDDLQSWLATLGLFQRTGIPTQDVDTPAMALVTFLATSTLQPAHAQLCIDIAIDILNTPFLPMGDDSKYALQAFKSSRNLATALRAWEVLGTTLEERLAVDVDGRSLRNLASVGKELGERINQCSIDMNILKSEHDRIAAIVDKASTTMLDDTLRRVRELHDKLINGMPSIIGPQRNWKDKLTMSSTWKDVVSVARNTRLRLEQDEPLSDICAALH